MPAPAKRLSSETSSARAVRRPVGEHHELLAGVKPHFLKTRKTEVGLLRPYKRLLVDIVTSERQLDEILEAANSLFLAFEKKGHRVTFAPPNMQMRRAAFDEREVPEKNLYHHMVWVPERITAVYVGDVPIGVTLFETTEEVEVVYVHGQYLTVSELSPAEVRRYQGPMHWRTKKGRASGRFCLQVYCPHQLVEWSRRWGPTSASKLVPLAPMVTQELEAAAPRLIVQVAEAEARAEAQRRQWEEDSRRWREEQERARQAKLRQDAKADLLAAIDTWDSARRVQDWLARAESAAQDLPEGERAHVLGRLEHARALVGDADPLDLLKRWKAPGKRQ
jgi:hypothetical protein